MRAYLAAQLKGCGVGRQDEVAHSGTRWLSKRRGNPSAELLVCRHVDVINQPIGVGRDVQKQVRVVPHSLEVRVLQRCQALDAGRGVRVPDPAATGARVGRLTTRRAAVGSADASIGLGRCPGLTILREEHYYSLITLTPDQIIHDG